MTSINNAVRSNAAVLAAIETLVARGLVPDDWLDASVARRSFAPRSLCAKCTDGLVIAPYRTLRGPAPRIACAACRRAIDSCAGRPTPESHDELIALALDPRAIETAEALGREAHARIPDLDPRPARVLWRFVDSDDPRSMLGSRSRDSLDFMPEDELGALSRAIRDPVVRTRLAHGTSISAPRSLAPRSIATAPEAAIEDLDAAVLWRAARSLSGRPLSARNLPRDEDERDLSPLGKVISALARRALPEVSASLARHDSELRSLCALPSPFEPAVELWNLGVGIQAVTARTIVLALPVVRS